jgi:transcriptional regulator with XRE-family HTH domain
MNYGDRISILRGKQGLTQGKLAKHTGITRAALSHYENNRRQPDYDTLKIIADYFNVTLDYLMWGVNHHREVLSSVNASKGQLHSLEEGGLHVYHVVHYQRQVFPSRLL